ncbi:hypothetical protein AMK59_4139 [Oryctes borbonicus]|uniref:SFR19-like C-terminal domain-containing protein n=1 Tax=Oryctes borbonicus TaxID=1629725 RepID=A0A0T6B5Q1_9SCAR|nr:hypothetical protein AMK59_4139 [Oryctes borbonicus]
MTKKPFALGDISTMTEDISEEERSYTPCLDERTHKQGLEGLDTEMISDDDRNDFDESHELKTASEGDALEINAKESELDFTKPEDYEEGEIVDKLKNKKPVTEQKTPPQETEKEPEKEELPSENKEPELVQTPFKKLSKSNKERNYRDKEKDKENVRSKSKERKSDKENKKSKKKEKRKDLERYNVRSIIAEKPRRTRDKFGRDEARKKSPSRSSRSLTPAQRRSHSRGRSYSRERAKKKRTTRTKSRSRTPAERRRSRSPRPRRQKSAERTRENASRDRGGSRDRQRWRNRSRASSASPRRRREWVRRSSKGWSRSLSRSYTPEKRLTPSWTPPRVLESQPVKPPNLTVILNNDHNKKKKEKRKNRKGKEIDKTKRRRRYRTPPPSKEVFASGNNILVSVSFNKDRNQRDVINKRKRDLLDDSAPRKQRKTKEKKKNDPKKKKKKKDLSGVKPVAIIDLDRSPFREVTPSPEDVIVLTDSENGESSDMLGLQKAICDSSQQVASPERPMNTNYLTGPKTPPEPQVKFSLNPKQTQMRAISNPLHEPDDIEEDIDPQEELEQRLNESLHKGPNTPPEPPNSPPSSPDAYDPFEPTKSRSPTPEPLPPVVQLSSTSQNDSVREESLIDSRNDDDETIDQSHTPPAITDIQPADSQCSNMKSLSPEKSPEQHIGVVINRVVQSQAAIFPTAASKTISSFSNTSMVTSTPMVPPRINILNSTVLTPTTIASALPQRIVLPNTTKSSPVKVSPNKLPIKSTPIKPMPAKNLMNKSNKSSRKSNNHAGNENHDTLLDFESPYSPGSSDYEDLFEPPAAESSAAKNTTTANTNSKQPSAQKPQKDQTAFDMLFGSSPVNNCFSKKSKAKSGNNNNVNKYKKNTKGTKQVGVKIDEDTLKILDELPNSAVEMQVKYKFVDDWVLTVDPGSTCSKEKLQYLKKLNRQERVVEEVKLVLKPHYNKKHINKEEYKDILRRAVPKICHNKSGEINPQKIQNLIEAYVKKIRHSKKVTSSSSVNPQKA